MNNNVKKAPKIVTGTVKWYDPVKGYGFITTEDGEDVYVNNGHIDTSRTFNGYLPGDKVTFSCKKFPNAKNATASHVRLAEDTETASEETTEVPTEE